jgi:hypothetical protein
MPGTDLSDDEILEAVRRLPARQRNSLLQDLAQTPSRAKALKVARRLGPRFRMATVEQRKLSDLLRKGNAEGLSEAERVELDGLVEKVLEKREELAKAVEEEFSKEKT